MKDKPIAFDDKELRNWLMDLIEEGPESFLCALAEAVVRADAEDYGVIRPALVELKRRYNDGVQKQITTAHASSQSGAA